MVKYKKKAEKVNKKEKKWAIYEWITYYLNSKKSKIGWKGWNKNTKFAILAKM